MGVVVALLCAFLELQVAQIRAVDLGASINPFSANKQFVVRIVEQLPAFEDSASERLTTYRDAEGQDFTCMLPASAPDGAFHEEQRELFKSESAEDLLKTISGDCVRQKEGWWVFEVCVGIRVRQYHTVRTVETGAQKYSAGTKILVISSECRRTACWMKST